MLYYFPLEPYQERYTEWLSSENGFWETWLKENHVPYVAIRGSKGEGRIKTGQVLDAFQRSRWAMEQVIQFIFRLKNGEIKDGDVIYIEDFWHPGFMALPYCRDLYGVDFKMYAFCHAQSVDPNDFTRKMMSWMRPFEQGIGKALDGIIVAAAELKEMLVNGSIATSEKIHVVGHPFYTELLLKMYPKSHKPQSKKEVIFASRWDTEKNPQFFADLINYVIHVLGRGDIHFRVCSGANGIKSNSAELKELAIHLENSYPENFWYCSNLTKEDYYHYLSEARVLFNCASQDFVSFTLLEAVTYGCHPLYPSYLTFPLALRYSAEHLYVQGSIIDAAEKLVRLIDGPSLGPNYKDQVLWPHRTAFERFVRIMTKE